MGTLIVPHPPAATIYAEVGRRFGGCLSVPAIRTRFGSALAIEDETDRQRGWQTDEDRERRRWQSIVAAVLDDVTDPVACFGELHRHFGQPGAWKVNEEAAEVLEALAGRGYALGLASNFDSRLRSVLAGLPDLKRLHHVVSSSEVGWRKPARAFYDAMIRLAACPAEQILHVGDDRVNDHDGARAAGLRAVLVDPTGKDASDDHRVGRLADVLLAT